MPTGTAYRRGVGLSLLSACLLVGCTSGGGSAASLPPVSSGAAVSSSVPTPSVSTSVTQTPVASSSTPSPSSTKDAVEAAVRAYYAAFDVAIRTGKTSAYRQLTTAACPCRKFATSVEELFASSTVTGGGVDLGQVQIVSVTSGSAEVKTKYRTLGYVAKSKGRETTISPATVQSSVTLGRFGGRWKITGEEILSRVGT